MVVAVWSVKGGVGASSIATMLALAHAHQAYETLIVDLCGDVPTLLGVEGVDSAPIDQAELGISDWCALAEPAADRLRRLEHHARPDLRFIHRGTGPLAGDPERLRSALSQSGRRTIVDCGVVRDPASFVGRFVQSAPVSVLVVRECFLNLRAAQRCPIVPTGVVVIKEPGRTLGRADVEAVTGAPVLGECAVDESVARVLDAGLTRARLPRGLIRSLGKVLNRAA